MGFKARLKMKFSLLTKWSLIFLVSLEWLGLLTKLTNLILESLVSMKILGGLINTTKIFKILLKKFTISMKAKNIY